MDLLQETREAFDSLKSNVVDAMQKLYKVFESKAWESVASSWSEYVESDLGISQGFASKLLAVNKHYLLEGGYSPENIRGVDYERLYLAAKSGGTIEEQLAKAKTLTRSELKQERNEIEPHEPEYVRFCKICNVSEQNHN
jgi:hypothetical protein